MLAGSDRRWLKGQAEQQRPHIQVTRKYEVLYLSHVPQLGIYPECGGVHAEVGQCRLPSLWGRTGTGLRLFSILPP
jgi:hypothetical protein